MLQATLDQVHGSFRPAINVSRVTETERVREYNDTTRRIKLLLDSAEGEHAGTSAADLALVSAYTVAKRAQHVHYVNYLESRYPFVILQAAVR